MQDSLEDYIRLVNNTKQNIVGNLNSQEKTIPWERKQQYENYAFKIIEFMIEGRLQPQVFVKSLNFIHQEHYQDIVEERAVTKLCGYPICGKRLPPMPKKQFHISTKQNKIYDITDRKLFCCNYCYQASEFIKKQIDTSPLWSRRPEDFPRFILLDHKEILRPGIEIDHGLVKLPTDHNFTSINSFTEACLDEAEEMEYNRLLQERDEAEKPPETKPKSILKKKKLVVNKNRIEEVDENEDNSKELKCERVVIPKIEGADVNIKQEIKMEVKVEDLQNTANDGIEEITKEEDASLYSEKVVSSKISLIEEKGIDLCDKMPAEIAKNHNDILQQLDVKIGPAERKNTQIKGIQIQHKTEGNTEKLQCVQSGQSLDKGTSEIQVKTTEFVPINPEKINLISERNTAEERLQEKYETDKSSEVTVEEILENFQFADKCKLEDNRGKSNKIEIEREATVGTTKLVDEYSEKNKGTKNTQGITIKTKSKETPNVDVNAKKKVTVKAEYSEPSTSGRKSVRFKTDPQENSDRHQYSKINARSNTPLISQTEEVRKKVANMKISEEEIADFKAYIGGICQSMGINIPQKTAPKPKEKPIEINEEKIKSVIQKVNASEESRNRRVQLIETNKNPEKAKRLLNPATEVPKYAHRIAEKVKPPSEDENLKVVIEKVKNLTVNKHKEDDKLKEVLEKIKQKGAKSKGSILINTSINPEVELPKKKSEIKPKPTEISSELDKIRICLLQWLTLETYIFIHGEARIKHVLNEQTLDGYFEKLKIAELQIEKQVKYMNICKKLKMRELAEQKFDGVLLKNYKQKKPLPDYGRLKEEGKDMDLKVKAFFVGSVYEKTDPNFKSKKGEGEGGEESPAVLPLVDASSQNAIRKKIFMNAVSKYVQVHIKELELDDNLLIEVQSMIKTFRLEADNIIFKPQIWNIIGFVLIMMITSKCELVKSKLSNGSADIYRELIFSKYSDGKGFLQRVLHIVERVDVYVENYIVSD